MESTANMDGSSHSCNGVIVQCYDSVEEKENLDEDIVKDFDSYFNDIENKLIVSRMVSDAVTRGMISAIEQDAMEKISQNDLELKKLKEALPLHHVGSDDSDSTRYSTNYNNPRSKLNEFQLTNSNEVVDHDKVPYPLEDLKFSAKDQFKKLKKEMHKIKGSTSEWVDVDRALDGLETTLQDIYIQSEDLVCSSKSVLFDWQQEIEFQLEIEGTVIKNFIQSLQEEFEKRLWDHYSQSYGNESANWLEIVKEISSLRQQLSSVSKFFSFPESGQLLSHGSLEHRNGSGDHFSSAPNLEENGNHDESTGISIPESLEHAELKNLSIEGLFCYFKTEMTNMKRQHELELQKETEKYYSLKRDKDLYMRELGSSLHLRKDKELDLFKKKIPEAILRLDNVLTDIQKLPPLGDHGDSLDNLKGRLECLRLENRQLRDSVMDKKKEIILLQSHASDALKQISKHSLAEETLSRKVKNLECILVDTQLEASISQDLYKFLLSELHRQMDGLKEELIMEYDMMLAIYVNMLKEASENVATVNKLDIEDSVMESIIIQGICEIVFRESFKEAEEKVAMWNQKYVDEMQVCVALEMKALEKENSLKFTIAEREKLEKENFLLSAMVDEKAKLLQKVAEELLEEKKNFEFASLELERLRTHSTQQDTVVSKYDQELHVVKNDLAEALVEVEKDRKQISELGEQLEKVMQNLREADEEKNILDSRLHKCQNALSLVEARETVHMEQMNSTMFLVQELSKTMTTFQCRTTENIKMNCLRLGNLSTQLGSLIQKANRLKRMGLQYKLKLERRSCDLQKAENEVDLLGDEVDALLSLLEKIYIALDHYSPILQHYPGIMEILKLVRRELSGESIKSV